MGRKPGFPWGWAYVAHVERGYTFREIGKKLGVSHTAVIQGVRKVRELVLAANAVTAALGRGSYAHWERLFDSPDFDRMFPKVSKERQRPPQTRKRH